MAGTEALNIVISGDNSDVLRKIEEIIRAISGVQGKSITLNADASQAVSEAGRIANAVEHIGDAHANITAEGTQAKQEINDVSASIEAIPDGNSNLGVDISEVKEGVAEASSELENVPDINAEVIVNTKDSVDKINQVVDAEQNIKGAHSEITGNAKSAVEAANQAKSALNDINNKNVKITVKTEIQDRAGNVQSRFRNMGRQAGEEFANEFSTAATNGINRVQDSLNALLSMNVGEKISAGFGAVFNGIISTLQKATNVILGVMKSALGVGGGFEAQMTNVKVISGATEEELDKLTKKAREMGATLPITAKDAATAMQMLVQRGTSASDTLATVDSVANLAIAQSTSMGEVAELLGTAMASFSIDISEAAKVTAVFNNACNQSPLSMQRLMAAMKYAAPAAGSLGISITEAVAAMEAIARVLPSGEMTGTGYAMVLSKVAAKSEIAGVKTRNLDGSLRSIKDIFLDLKEAQASYAELNKVFGQRGVKAALALQQNAEALEEYEEKLKNYSTTQGAVDEKAKTFTNTMAALRSAIEEFHINIFEQIKEQSKEAVGGITALVRAFSDWVGQTQIASKALNAFLEGLGFKIPSADDFRRFLDELDIQAFVDNIKDLGESLRDIGEKIIGAIDKIKSPLLWLIEHLDSFMTISFWGWISGKALQIPAAIIGISFAFKELYAAGQLLLGLSWAKLAPLISLSTLGTGGAIVAGLGTLAYSANKMFTAKAELKEALDVEKRYLAEQAQADLSLPLDIKFNLKTGFEKLPESWAKASDQVRAEVNTTVKEIQEQFRGKVAEAVEFVAEKFPEMSAALAELADNNDVIMARISAALHGSEQDFEALPEFYRKVVERINAVDLGFDKLGNDFTAISKKYVELKQEIEKPLQPKVDANTALLQNISESVQSVMTELPAEIERARQFLNGSDGQLAVEVSLSGAKEKLEKFVKSISKEYSIPHSLVENTIANQLKELAHSGDTAAASLLDGWGKVGNEFENFIQRAKDAVNFLGVAPQTFDTAIEHLLKGIKEVDPVTGKVTEQFKKAYNTLKEWNNLSFSKLTQSLNMLKKAIEGGFVDKNELEKTFQSVSNQVKLKVVTDLRPMEGMLSPKAFQSSVASEYISVMQELGGDTFLKKIREEFSRISANSGEAMGRAILAHVDSDVGGGTFTLNGADQTIKELSATFSQSLGTAAALLQNIPEAVSPYVMRLEQLNPIQGNSGASITASPVQTAITQPSVASELTPLTSEFQKLTATIEGAKSFIEGNTSALRSFGDSVLSLVNYQGGTAQGVSYSAIKDYSAEIALVVRAIQDSSAANVQAVNDVKSAFNSVGETAKSQSQQEALILDATAFGKAVATEIAPLLGNQQSTTQDITVDLLPVITALNNVVVGLGAVQSLAQANNEAVNNVVGAVNSVGETIKSQQEGTALDTGALTQALIGGIAPFISSLEQTRGVYQDSSSTLAGNIQSLGQNIDSLTKSTEGSISALSQLQTALSQSQSQNTSIDLSQVISELQGISAVLKAVQNQDGSSQDFSSTLSPVIEALKNISAGLASVQNTAQANMEAVNNVAGAVSLVEAAVKSQQQNISLEVNENIIAKAVTEGINPLVAKLEQNNSALPNAIEPVSRNIQQLIASIEALKKSTEDNSSAISKSQSAGNNTATQDLSTALSPVVEALKNLSTALASVQNNTQANIQAVNDVVNAVNSVEKAVAAQQTVNEGNITQGVISGFAPLVSRIEQNTSTYQGASLSMIRALQDLSSILDTLKKSADTSNSNMIQLQASMKEAANSYDATNITSAVTPITGAVQNLATALTAIHVIQQANSAAMSEVISSIRSVENALKDMNAGNTYDIDIIQQGFSVGSKSDADYTARSAASALRSGIGNGGI